MNKEKTDKIYNAITSNGCREMDEERFHQAVNEVLGEIKSESQAEYEPYFGWCDVEGCNNEGAIGGGCWRESGYWAVCSDHSRMHREGKPQPKMKQSAIDREKTRGEDGIIPYRNTE